MNNNAQWLSAAHQANDVPPRCGGFTIWPGSHRKLYRCWSRNQNPHHPHSNGGRDELLYESLLAGVLRDTAPVEIVGTAGTVCFWHNRLVHDSGLNCSGIGDGSAMRVRKERTAGRAAIESTAISSARGGCVMLHVCRGPQHSGGVGSWVQRYPTLIIVNCVS